MKQLEFDFTDCTPSFKEWLAETNHDIYEWQKTYFKRG